MCTDNNLSYFGPAGLFSKDDPLADRLQIMAEEYDEFEDQIPDIDDYYDYDEDCPVCGAPPGWCSSECA